MRTAAVLLALAMTASSVLADEKCNSEINAAFVKQRQAPAFKTLALSETPNGMLERTIVFMAPDRLHSKIVSPTEDAPVETIGVGVHAWANTERGWEEMPPQLAQLVEDERKAFAEPPKVGADFSCLSGAKYEGKDYTGYATKPSKDEKGNEVVTVIYIDGMTGLPAAYVVKPAASDDKFVFKATYTYGPDVVVMAPVEKEAAEEAAAAAKK
jgi:hypothetical protein